MSANIKTNFIHVCDYASFGEGGKLNILGIFKSINVASFPSIHPQMFIITNISINTAGDYKEVIKLTREEDGFEIINPLEFNISSNRGNSEIGIMGQINNVKFEKEGVYKFKIFVNDTLISEVPLAVNKINL